MNRTMILTLVAAAALAATGCSSANAAGDAPADSTAAAGTAAAAAKPVARARVLASGTALVLRSAVTITSASNHAGDPVTATMASAAVNAGGDQVIPAGAVLSGSITNIKESTNAHSPGTLELAFNSVTIGSRNYPIQVSVTSLETHKASAGVTTDDAAKVAAGAAVGAIAGTLIGHNTRGTVIGAGAGAVGGAVYANQSRNRDVVLSSGASINAVLTGSFTRH